MSQASGGSMAAVVGSDLPTIEKILQANGLTSIDIANFNSPTQIVLAGPKEDLIKAEKPFKAAGARFLLLNVSAPFHSRYMHAAMEEFRGFLENFQFSFFSVIGLVMIISALAIEFLPAQKLRTKTQTQKLTT